MSISVGLSYKVDRPVSLAVCGGDHVILTDMTLQKAKAIAKCLNVVIESLEHEEVSDE